MTFNFTDTITIDGTRKRADGYLVADAKVARTGVQRYLGSEVGKPEMAFVDVYRSPEEVFSVDAMASFAHIPVTNDHPSEAVTAANWKQLAVGQTSDEIRQDDMFLRVPLMVADGAAITDVEGGKRELSNGYRCDVDFVPGVSPDGVKFDAQQKNIRGNHIAIVQAGRAGKECRIGDGSSQNWGLSPITTQQKDGLKMAHELRNMMVDGLPVADVSDASGIAITKLIGDRDALQTLIDSNKVAHDAVVADLTAKLAAADAATADANAKILDQAGIDQRVTDRVALESTARLIQADVKTAGLSDSAIREAVVLAKLGDKALAMADGKDAAYRTAFVDARFATLVESVKDTKTNDAFVDFKNVQTPVANVSDAQAIRQAAFDNLVHFDAHGTEKAVN